MKRIILFFISILLTTLCFAQNDSSTQDNINGEKPIEIEAPNTFPIFQEGLSSAFITRIAFQENRSNFVFNDTLLGAYFQMNSKNMQPIDSMIRVSLYYPTWFSFNNVPYTSSNILRYAIDTYAGIVFPFSMWKVVNFSFTPGFHFNYQTSDRFNFILLGLGGQVSMELPLTAKWTILFDCCATIDYPNLGTNSTIEPYNLAYMYQCSLGVRYSKKSLNLFFYIK